MYFKLKSNIIFRNYTSFGYLTDNRNFGYKLINQEDNHIGDKILSESGAVFLSILDKKPQTIDDISIKINMQFPDVDFITILNDAQEFYRTLEREGFVVSGKTPQECQNKDVRFSYRTSKPKIMSADGYSKLRSIEKSTQDFLEEHFKGNPQLTNLHIEIISKCNERCLHCYIPHENKINHITSELFYDILEQCRALNLLHLTISGGEPMLHKNFCEFLRKCREYDFSVNILSNLTLLDDSILNEMKANPLLGVQVSLYSMSPNIHDEITQMKGSFEKTKKAILKLIDHDIPIQISCPIMRQNKDSYKDVVRWAGERNIQVGDDYVILARYDHTTSNLNCRLSIDEVRELIKDKFVNNEKYFEQLEISTEKKKNIQPGDYICSVCNSSICISENGNVYPCAGWQDYILGNIAQTSLRDIWENSERAQYLRNLRNKDFPKCIKCSDKAFCTMCMVRNANESPIGDPLTVNEYFCQIAHLNRQLMIEWNKAKKGFN